VFNVSIFGGLEVCLGGISLQKAPRGDGTGINPLTLSTRLDRPQVPLFKSSVWHDW